MNSIKIILLILLDTLLKYMMSSYFGILTNELGYKKTKTRIWKFFRALTEEKNLS